MRTLPALLIAVSLTCGATLRAQPDLAALDAYLADALVKFDQPGLAVGVVKDGQLVWSKGYGKLDLAKADPVTPNSIFYMASISKAFTACTSASPNWPAAALRRSWAMRVS